MKLSVSRQFFETGVINYGSGWMKDVVNQCLEFDSYWRSKDAKQT